MNSPISPRTLKPVAALILGVVIGLSALTQGCVVVIYSDGGAPGTTTAGSNSFGTDSQSGGSSSATSTANGDSSATGGSTASDTGDSNGSGSGASNGSSSSGGTTASSGSGSGSTASSGSGSGSGTSSNGSSGDGSNNQSAGSGSSSNGSAASSNGGTSSSGNPTVDTGTSDNSNSNGGTTSAGDGSGANGSGTVTQGGTSIPPAVNIIRAGTTGCVVVAAPGGTDPTTFQLISVELLDDSASGTIVENPITIAINPAVVANQTSAQVVETLQQNGVTDASSVSAVASVGPHLGIVGFANVGGQNLLTKYPTRLTAGCRVSISGQPIFGSGSYASGPVPITSN